MNVLLLLPQVVIKCHTGKTQDTTHTATIEETETAL